LGETEVRDNPLPTITSVPSRGYVGDRDLKKSAGGEDEGLLDAPLSKVLGRVAEKMPLGPGRSFAEDLILRAEEFAL